MNLTDIRNFANSSPSCQRVFSAKEARELLVDLELAIHAARVEGRIHENTGKLTKQTRMADVREAIHRAIMDTPHQVMFGAIPSPGQESVARNQQANQRTQLDEAVERGMIAPPMPSTTGTTDYLARARLDKLEATTQSVRGHVADMLRIDKRFAAIEAQLEQLPAQSAEACIAKYANWGRRIAELERHWDDLHKRLEALERMHDGQPEKTTAWEKRIEARLMALEARYVHGSGCQKEGDPSTADECIECEPVCQRTYPLDPLTAENPCDDCGRDERKHETAPFVHKGTYLDGYQKGREEVQKLKLNSELAESDRKELARYRAHTPGGQLRYGYREDGSRVFDGSSTPAQLAAYETAMSQRAREQAMPAEPKKLSDE